MRTCRACRCSADLPEGGVRTFFEIDDEDTPSLALLGHVTFGHCEPLPVKSRRRLALTSLPCASHPPFRSGNGTSLPIEIDLPAVRAKI